jgi:hypothetical protein
MDKSSSSEEDSFFITRKDVFHDNMSAKKSVYTSKTITSKKKTTDPVGKGRYKLDSI